MRNNLILTILLPIFYLSGPSLLAQEFLTITFQQTNLSLTATQFAALPHTDIKAADPHEKAEHQYSVVSVRELLTQAGVPSGDKLRGSALRDVVMVRAEDGYSVAFTLADFDEAYGGQNICLADKMDGKPLSETAGPLRLVIPTDKKGARWVRMVNKIEVFDPDHK